MSEQVLQEVVLGAQGIFLTYVENSPEGVDAQRVLRIEPEVLGEAGVEEVNAFLERIDELVTEALAPAEEHGPYDNPEEVERWGAGED